MKKVFLVCFLAAISVLGVNNLVFSQISTVAMGVLPTEPSMLRPEVDKSSISDVNDKTLRNFKKMFATVEDVKWFNYKGASAAIFVSGEVRFRVEYDSKGNWCATEKDYNEAKLDRDVRKVVKCVYFDHTITSIREIRTVEYYNDPIYIIHIEDAAGFKNVTVYNGEMSVVDEYEKN